MPPFEDISVSVGDVNLYVTLGVSVLNGIPKSTLVAIDSFPSFPVNVILTCVTALVVISTLPVKVTEVSLPAIVSVITTWNSPVFGL